jgi:4,5-DOPA dioxygenase extradiol
VTCTGFRWSLFDVQYPAPGSSELAEQVADVVKPTWVGQDVDSWGIDHGTWSVLQHAFPDASIPVVQLSMNALLPWHVRALLSRLGCSGA